MFGRENAALGSRVRGKLAALTLAGGMVVSGAFVALTPSTASAQAPNPLGPTIAQIEAVYATAVANAETTIDTLYWDNLYLDLFGPFGLESTISCLVHPPQFGPCVDGG
jgi:hypothetical protein